jgi:hypothetical protein
MTMLRSNTKKQLTYYPQNQLEYYHRKQLTYYPQKKLSYSSHNKFNFYHLIASFFVGLLGGWAINYFYHNHHYQSFSDTSSLAEIQQPRVVNVAYNTGSIVKVDEKTAFNSVWNLPQVQRKAREIERLSQGSIKVAATIDSYPTAQQPFYVVKVFENHPDKTTSPVYWFRVSSSTGVIEPLDLLQNQYIALEDWNPDGR